MDGNGRWAKKRGLPRNMGHRQGAKAFVNVINYCIELGIECASFYAFSTENWKRPKQEIDGIITLLNEYIKELRKTADKNVKIVFLGDISVFGDDISQELTEIQSKTVDNTGTILAIALNYGGRTELARAARLVAEDVKNGLLDTGEIDEKTIESKLYTAALHDVDLRLRLSGEETISNFLLWQIAYAEFVFMDVLWPDFGKKDLNKAIEIYSSRNRRFGGL